jgi:hypothetical protein
MSKEKTMSKNALLSVVCALVAFASMRANAGGICWIDKVTKSSQGIEVHFMSRANLSISMSGKPGLEVTNGVVRQMKDNGEPGPETPLLLTGGQSVSVNAGLPEDTCTIIYAIENGIPGVTAHSANNASPYAHTQTSSFYPAG